MKWFAPMAASSAAFLFSGCYTAQQGFSQARLILRRQPLESVLEKATEPAERLEKLRVVPKVLAYARDSVGLDIGKSYTQYIALEGPSVTYVVQAAEKRRLAFKTWWFPIVGSQPYLGFFKREDALTFREKMVKEGFDTTLGGVEAFSLLGYFPDPLYSSMLDGNDTPELIEVLIHECVHRTLYIPNYSAFNENLADFIAKKATARFLRLHAELGKNADAYELKYLRFLKAQTRFKEFLGRARTSLEEFYRYAESLESGLKDDDAAFLLARAKKFDTLADEYKAFMAGAAEGTGYAYAFSKGKINNAVVLGYSLYEAKQEPFEKAYAAAQGELPKLMANLARCLEKTAASEDELWSRVEECR